MNLYGKQPGSYKIKLDCAADITGTVNNNLDSDKSWTCEVAVPFADLTQNNLLKAKGPWLILIARQNYNGKVVIEQRELSVFPQLSKSNFHLNDEYAGLKLVR